VIAPSRQPDTCAKIACKAISKRLVPFVVKTNLCNHKGSQSKNQRITKLKQTDGLLKDKYFAYRNHLQFFVLLS